MRERENGKKINIEKELSRERKKRKRESKQREWERDVCMLIKRVRDGETARESVREKKDIKSVH